MASTESLVGFVLNSSLKNFGDIYVSALAILQSAMQFASVPLTGFAQGFVPIISYNYGHGDKQRVKDCFRIVLIVMFSFNLILMLFMILFPSTVASAFTSDEELIDTVRWVMPIFLAGMTIFGLQRACQNMFVALGQAKISIFIALLRKVILLIPLALLLPHFMGGNRRIRGRSRIGCHGRYLLYVVIYMEIPEDTRENQAKRRKGCPITDSPLIKP